MLPPSVFNRLWNNQWIPEGEGDHIPPVWIDRAIRLPYEQPEREEHWFYVGGLDMSWRRDRLSFVVLGIDTVCEMMHVAAVREWEPVGGEIDFATAKAEILELHQRFGFASMRSDVYASTQLSQELQIHGINHRLSPMDLGEHTITCNGLLRVFREQEIALFRHPSLIRDLHELMILERANGQLKLHAERNERGHADAGFALARAIREAFYVMQMSRFELFASQTSTVITA